MKKNIFYLVLSSTILLSACSTDLDVVGDYKETMVVYGLLDQSQTKQYIKVNKAFLGEGNAFGYAQVQDSVQFANSLVVKLKRLSDGTEYSLTPDNSIPKDNGIFYGPDQANAIYSNPVPFSLSTNSEYQLIIRNGETGNEVTSKTNLVHDFSFISPTPTSLTFTFVIPTSPNFPFEVKWNSSKYGKIYQLVLRFHYTEYIGSDTTEKSLDWVFAPQKSDNTNGGQEMLVKFKGQEFLQYVGGKLSQLSSPDYRKAGQVDLLLIAGAEDLSTFIDVNAPSTGIIQERPEFTNITNGLGIFSARYNKAPYSKPLSATTIDSLACGQYTKKLNFANFSNVAGACPP